MSKRIIYLLLTYIFLLFFKNNSFSQNLFNVIDVNYYPDNSIVIKLDKDIKPEFFKLDNPTRWVLDFPSSIYKPVKKSIDVNNELIKQIRLSQNDKNIVRLTIELNKDIEFEYRSIIENNFQIITLIALDNSQVINIDDKKIEEHKEKNYLVSLFDNKDNSIIVETSRKIDYLLSKQDELYIIRLKETKNRIKNNKIKLSSEGMFESIDVNEEEDTVINIKTKNNSKLKLVKKDDFKIEIRIEKEEPINKDKSILVSIENIDNTDKLGVYNENYKKFKYNIFTLDNPYRLVIDIIGDFEVYNLDYLTNNSKYVKKVRSGKLKDDLGVRIVLDIDKNVSYKHEVNSSNVLELSLFSDEKNTNIIKGRPLVVIDAGHGGNDPGAIGNGVVEKEVTLKVSYYLKDLLLNNNFNVIMTRSDDSEILLKPRVNIANLNNADIFVSIHCNSTEGPGPMGIETYYRTEQSSTFAKFIHKNLINSLPTIDRGIRIRNFYVIKNTKMPSVLVEIGYLTNKIEASRLSTESYQRDIAKALLNGIKEYFNNRNKF